MPFLYMIGIFYFILEIFLVLYCIDLFGIGWVLLEMIGSAFLGILILVRIPLKISNDFSKLFQKNLSPMAFLSANFICLIGAIFLIFPGILSDVVGIILECIGLLMLNFPKHKEKSQYDSNNDKIIDVEIIPEEKT
ncbi:FxsA family protein [Helicobacter sp. 13S00477-4]|uniref:FxsA family protein n=1 Tax=Helicobacter sp. 13S00477-4 TaxID=1905759 RepID=UPI000BA60FA0|nr:FxsA family protein [Helicobacter sp. 13S00477-4]PAF50602.1 hypothetical protein BKH44_07520 [Helicobacter sp. 13S00477-4]